LNGYFNKTKKDVKHFLGSNLRVYRAETVSVRCGLLLAKGGNSFFSLSVQKLFFKGIIPALFHQFPAVYITTKIDFFALEIALWPDIFR